MIKWNDECDLSIAERDVIEKQIEKYNNVDGNIEAWISIGKRDVYITNRTGKWEVYHMVGSLRRNKKSKRK